MSVKTRRLRVHSVQVPACAKVPFARFERPHEAVPPTPADATEPLQGSALSIISRPDPGQ